MSTVHDRPWSLRPGGWLGVFGPRATVLLSPEQPALAARIFSLVDDGAGFDETLDALLVDGLSGLPGFALLAAEDDRVRVLARGAVRVRLMTDPGGESAEVEGADAHTWVERTVVGATRVSITTGEANGETAGQVIGAEDAGLALVHGLARIASAEQPVRAADQSDHAAAPAQAAARIDVEEGGVRSPAAPPAAPPGVPLTGPPTPPPLPPPVVGFDQESDTRTGGLDPMTSQPPGIPGQPQPPAVTAEPVARLLISSGDEVAVDRAIVIGRAPEAGRSEAGEPPRLMTVPSPQLEISATHLEVRPGSGADHGLAVVTDLGSTNGTVLVQPGLPPESLPAGVAVQLIPGAVIDLGDGLSIQVHSP